MDHPMLKESDGLFAESSDDVVGWLLEVRQPSQRVMTTIIGRSGGLSDPNTGKSCTVAAVSSWATPGKRRQDSSPPASTRNSCR